MKKNETNYRIKALLQEKGMKHWELAELLGISEGTLTRRFRKELSEEETERIIQLIEGRSKNDE